MKYPFNKKTPYYLMLGIDSLLKILLPKHDTPISKIKKILLCNISHLGDVILTTSLLKPLKEAIPECQIGCLIGSWSNPIIEKHPDIQWIHHFDHWKLNREKHSKFQQHKSSFKKALGEIKNINYDVSIDLSFHYPSSCYLLWKANLPVRIGFISAGLSPFLTHSLPWKREENLSVIYSYYRLLTLLPVPISLPTLPSLPISSMVKEKSYIVIHIGAGNPAKEWPIENWQKLVAKLALKDLKMIFTGKTSREKEMIEKIIQNVSLAKNYAGLLNWTEFVALIQNARFLVSVETSAGHVAAAVNTPAVLLYTAIHPLKLWSPTHPKIRVVAQPLPCSPCFKGCPSMKCLRTLSVEEIYNIIMDDLRNQNQEEEEQKQIAKNEEPLQVE